MIISKRFPGEKHDIREFVQPDTIMVRELALTLMGGNDFVTAAWQWVCNNIKYPPGDLASNDRHYLEAFSGGRWLGVPVPILTLEARDFWQFPSETLAFRMGDCDDMAILLGSLLRTQLSERDVFCVAGYFNGMGHMWVRYKDLVLDPTPFGGGKIMPLTVGRPYRPLMDFNDKVYLSAAS